jgi:PKD repeat protein
VSFSAAGSHGRDGGPLSFAWDFDGDGVADARDPDHVHVYAAPGDFTAQLVVSDGGGHSSVANLAINAGNSRPEVTIEWPPDGGVVGFGEPVEFRVRAHDAEDGAAVAGDVVVQPHLGHDTHAHPLHQVRGANGTVVPLPDDGHGTEADLFGVLTATGTDRGAAGLTALAGRSRIVLQPRRKQAEFTARHAGTRLEKTDDPAGGGQSVVFERGGDAVSYRPVNLHGIDAVTLRLAAALPGSALELRLDGPDGPVLGVASVAEARSSLALAARKYPIRVEYFERGGGAGLILRVEGPELPRQVVPPALLMRDEGPGLSVRYYDAPGGDRLPDFARLQPYGAGVIRTIDFPSSEGEFAGSGRSDEVGAVIEGFLRVPVAGDYRFWLESDDGARLFIDDRLLIDNDGVHPMVEKALDLAWVDAAVPIAPVQGTHELFLVYVAPPGGTAPLKLNWLHFHGPGVAAGGPAPDDHSAPSVP